MIYYHDFQLQSKMHVLLHLLVLKSITQYLYGMEVRPEDTLHMAVSMCQAFYVLMCKCIQCAIFDGKVTKKNYIKEHLSAIMQFRKQASYRL